MSNWSPESPGVLDRVEINLHCLLFLSMDFFPGVFPFDFQFGIDAGAGLDGGPPNEEDAQESPPTSQPSRRSARERRVNSRLDGYAGSLFPLLI